MDYISIYTGTSDAGRSWLASDARLLLGIKY